MSNAELLTNLAGCVVMAALSPLIASWGWKLGYLLRKGYPGRFWRDEFDG